jgi:RNA polymerase subunit RPABC4/transcription elongation factor Spt4
MLEPCRECGQLVSTEAMKCPHCGVLNPAPTRQQSQARAVWISLAVMLGMVLVVFAYCSSVANDLFEPASPAEVAARRANNVTPERFNAELLSNVVDEG